MSFDDYTLEERIKVRAYFINQKTKKSADECWYIAEKIEKMNNKLNKANNEVLEALSPYIKNF